MTTAANIPPLFLGTSLMNYFFSHVALAHDPRLFVTAPHGFYTLVKPLHVFKKATSRPVGHGDDIKPDRIVNLIIPAGAEVYVDRAVFAARDGRDYADRKMRASHAVVHSIARYVPKDGARKRRIDGHIWLHSNPDYVYHPDDGEHPFDPASIVPATEAYSAHDSKVVYRPGKKMIPDNGFSPVLDQCEAGIHFFLNLRDALEY